MGSVASVAKPPFFAWVLLLITILLEVVASYFMKLSNGYTHLVPAVISLLSYAACLILLTYTAKFFELSTLYAVWSGVGTAAVAIIGVYVFKESATLMKLVSLCAIIFGVVG